MFKWLKLIKWIKAHRTTGRASFTVETTSDTFIITVKKFAMHKRITENNRLEIKF